MNLPVLFQMAREKNCGTSIKHIMIKDCFLDHSIPVLWALLTRKTIKAYYDGVFEPLRRTMEERVAGAAYFENKAVVVDFELAISAALRAAFPNFR